MLNHGEMGLHEIVISVDTNEGAEFAMWLRQRGHSARVGTSTGNYIDGVWTSTDEAANQIMGNLWDRYCRGC